MAISKTQQMRPSLIDAVDTLNSVAPIVQETPVIDFGHTEFSVNGEELYAPVVVTFNTVKPEPPVFLCSPHTEVAEPMVYYVESVTTEKAVVQIFAWGYSKQDVFTAHLDWVAISGR